MMPINYYGLFPIHGRTTNSPQMNNTKPEPMQSGINP